MAREFVKLGYTIGLGGPVTFKNAKTPKEVAADVDLAHLQIETDCPYLTPVPYRGKRNEPMYLPLTAKTILELRGMEGRRVGNRVFGIPIKPYSIRKTNSEKKRRVYDLCERRKIK